MKRISILGATGSVGQSTLDIVALHPADYELFALTANSSWQKMEQLCRRFTPSFAVMSDVSSASKLQNAIVDLPTVVLAEESGLEQVASAVEVDIVVAAIVGSVGLMPTLAAVRAGKRVLLANKESKSISWSPQLSARSD